MMGLYEVGVGVDVKVPPATKAYIDKTAKKVVDSADGVKIAVGALAVAMVGGALILKSGRRR